MSEKEKRNGLVTGTGRGKEKIFFIMRVFSPHRYLMIFPDCQCSKYYMLLCLENILLVDHLSCLEHYPVLEYSFAFGLSSGRWLYRHPPNESYLSTQLVKFSLKGISHVPRSTCILFSLTLMGCCNSEIKYLISKNTKLTKILVY